MYMCVRACEGQRTIWEFSPDSVWVLGTPELRSSVLAVSALPTEPPCQPTIYYFILNSSFSTLLCATVRAPYGTSWEL